MGLGGISFWQLTFILLLFPAATLIAVIWLLIEGYRAKSSEKSHSTLNEGNK
jgi:hypothetical protein